MSSFFSDLAQENPNELCNQNDCSITTQSTKSTQTVSGDTTVTGSTTAEPPSGQTPTSEPPSSQTKKPKTRKSAHGWMGPVVEEMMIVGNRSNSVMRMINQFIITTGINKKLVSQTTIRNKMRDILLKKKLNHNVKRQTVIGCDARCDNTLTLKNQLVKEEHMTFVDKSGNYVDHKTLSNKKSVTISGHIMDVLEQYDSKETLQILKTDGESANTGRTVNDEIFNTCCQVLILKSPSWLVIHLKISNSS